MKNFTKVLSLLLLSLAALFVNPAQASHNKGADIYFDCLGNGVYKIYYAFYRDCSAGSSSAPTSVSFDLTSSCPSIPTTLNSINRVGPIEVAPICPGITSTCSGGSFPGTSLYLFESDTFSIPPGCTVSASSGLCCRNANITNLSSPDSYGLEVTATVTGQANNDCVHTPQFFQYAVPYFCLGQQVNYSQGAFDLDGDSLVYTLINPHDVGGTNVPFVNASCTATNPLGSPTQFASTFNFNQSNGLITFTPTQTGNYVLAVQVSAYRHGTLVGTTQRDIQFAVQSCSGNNIPYLINKFDSVHVTGALIIDSTRLSVCPGNQLSFTLSATDADSFNYLIDSTNINLIMPGATYFYTHSGTKYDTVTLHVSWTPTGSDSGFHALSFAVRDTFCPIPGRQVYPFVIFVRKGLYGGQDLVYCNTGDPVTMQASGANQYSWTDLNGGPPVGVVGYNSDSSALTVAPPVSTTYLVHSTTVGLCTNVDTVFVKNAPIFTLNTTAQDPAICKYTTTSISTVPTATFPGTFTYQWNPAPNVVSATDSTTAIKPLIRPTWFKVTVTSSKGCVQRDSVLVSLSGAAPRININPSNNNFCPGDTITLNGIALAESIVQCGTVDTCADNSILSSQAVGADTSVSTDFEGPYYGFYENSRVQYLIRASEMNAAGLSSGSITDISFFVKNYGSTIPYDNFTVSMGCTTLDSLTGFVNGLTVVAPAFPYTVSGTGWNPHPFTHYYNWDGTSNLIVEVCYAIAGTAGNADEVAYTQTPYSGSVVYAHSGSGGVTGCGLNLSNNFFNGLSSNRPDMKFGMCTPNVLTYSWSPSTLLCDTCPVTQVVVPSDTTYKLTVSFANCTNDSSVHLTTNKNIAFTAGNDTTICLGDTIQLHASLTNAPPSVCRKNYTVTSVPYAAISGTATIVPSSAYISASGFQSTDDATAGPYSIGFNFDFFCQSYSQFWVNSNGWISFENPYPATQSYQERNAQTLPPSAADMNPQKMIAMAMGDYELAPTGAGNIRYFVSGTAPNRILVVKMNGMQEFFGTGVTTGELHLYEGTGVIEIMINRCTYSSAEHTTGIKETTGVGVAAPGRNNQLYTISTPEGWKFTPQNGSSIAVGSSVWSPATGLSSTSVNNPYAYPTSTQTYVVQSNLTLNQFTNPSSCAVRDTVTVSIDNLTHTLTAAPLNICPGDTTQITFTPSGPVTSYTWTPTLGLSSTTIGNPFATVTDTTKYVVTALDANGCKTKDSLTINVYPTPRLSLKPDHTVCYSDSIQLTFPGAYSAYQWYVVDSTTGSRTPISTATSIYAHPRANYQLRVKSDTASCYYFTDVVLVDSFPHISPTVVPGGPLAFCQGGSVSLAGNAGLSNFSWSPAGNTATITATNDGAYAYTASDANGCVLRSDTARVVVTAKPTIALNTVKNTICTNDTVNLVATVTPPTATVYWTANGTQTPGASIVATYPGGTYQVNAAVGTCSDSTTFTLNNAVSPTVTLGSNITVCTCDPAVVLTPTVTPPTVSRYVWSDGTTGSLDTVRSKGSTTQSVIVYDNNNCSATASVNVTALCLKATAYPASDTIFASDTTTLSTTTSYTGTFTYIWTPAANVLNPTSASTGATAQYAGSDTFRVIVTDPVNGCLDSTYVTFFVLEQGRYAMATAFTPNEDGKNDFFYPVLNGGGRSSARVTAFRIYNRWGQLIYDNPLPKGWDGKINGEPQASGTYSYFVAVETPDPNNPAKTVTLQKQGSFQLMR
jgi:gliding motility-associated-like protein